MCRWMVGLSSLIFSFAMAAPPQTPRVVIDGQLTDTFWQNLTPAKLVPVEPAVPVDWGGEVRAAMAGQYLYISAHLPEPSGRVTARAIGRNPIWEAGGESVASQHNDAPEGEDFVRFDIRVTRENDWRLQVGPLGSYSVLWRWTGEREWYQSRPDKCNRFLVATQLNEKEWTVEAAIPLDQIGSPGLGGVRLSTERNRAARPGAPAEHWRAPDQEVMAEVVTIPGDGQKVGSPLFKPPLLGNREPAIEVGFSKDLPPLESGWTDPVWRAVPVWTLYRNEASARMPRFPTEVKLVHDGHSLAVLARCVEPGRVIARAKERDGPVDEDDSFQVYLATSGSAYVQYAINAEGYVLDAVGYNGNPRVSRPHSDWNSPVLGMAHQGEGEWIARLDLPLDAIKEVLGEVQTPREWRVLMQRHRPSRDGMQQETSVLPITQSVTPFCPARYRRLNLVDTDPSQLHAPSIPEGSGNLAFFPTDVLTPEQRKEVDLAGMVELNIRKRTLKILQSEKHDWEQVSTLTDWERFRDQRIRPMVASMGKFPDRGPLDTRVISEYRGNGYRRENLVYQSQPGLWVTANLYLPAEPNAKMPGIIIIHSHHAPKSQFELQDMGIIWARSGCAVLVPDQIGFGDRLQNYPWDREPHNSSRIVGIQLQLVDENLMKWIVWDTLRGVDLLLERKDIARDQIILMGAVAGGGDPAAVAAALDSRIAAVVPFNFGESEPEELRTDPNKNQWPLDLADPGWGDMVSTGALRGAVLHQFFPWTICASVAPRRFIYSFELGWNVEDLPAWARYKKVFELYSARDHLADAHGFGPFPGPGECWNIGPAQRRSLYPTLERWFGIPIPFTEAQSSVTANIGERVTVDRRPVPELTVLSPSSASELHMRSIHDLAREEGQKELNTARSDLERMTPSERREWLKARWASMLGDIEPDPHPQGVVQWSKQVSNALVEGITLTTEPGITVPLLLLRPRSRPGNRLPVVVGVAEGGKDLFLAKRDQEIESLLNGGTAVCLPDVRGTGETSPNPTLDPDGDEIREHLAGSELMLGETLLGKRLKDLRTVVAYLGEREELDSQRLGLWGDSFAPPNPAHLIIDEQAQWEVGPEIEQQAEPLGGLLATFGALFEDRVRTVAVRGGLANYLSVLDDNFVYVSPDVIVPGILKVGDIPDVVAALAPRPILLEGLVDGRDRLVPAGDLKSDLAPVYQAYRGATSAALLIRTEVAASEFASWFLRTISAAPL